LAQQVAAQFYDAIGLLAFRQNIKANSRIDKADEFDGIAPALAEPIHRVKPALVQFSGRRRWLGFYKGLDGGTRPCP
jgi:hypothetical protein